MEHNSIDSSGKTKKLSSVKVFLRGGLGNQLFQYALGLHESLRNNRKLVIREDLLPIETDQIAGVSRWPNQIKNFRHSGKIEGSTNQPPFATNFFGKYMQAQRIIGDYGMNSLAKLGVLASEKANFNYEIDTLPGLRVINSYASSKIFALKHRPLLVEQISDLINPSDDYQQLADEILEAAPVVVHLRMGDYLPLSQIYGTLTSGYLERALSQINTKTNTPIWVFTQDKGDIEDFMIETLKPARIIDSEKLRNPIENLLLMSKGRGLICSNSTFSWWAAFLKKNEEPVVVPTFDGKTNIFSASMRLDKWITVSGE